MKRFYSLTLVLGLSLSLAACQSLTSTPEPVIDPTRLEATPIATLEPAVRNFNAEALSGIDTVIANYTRLLPLLVAPEEKLRVLHRLADLKLLKGEELMVDQAVDELGIAISAYQGLLEKYPDREVNDQVLYQLAKSYDLQGRQAEYLDTMTRLMAEYPDTQFKSEVQFRRGEVLFTNQRYREAEQAFAAVIDTQDENFLVNAHYMKGWSLFKQTRFELALNSYVAVLDALLLHEEGHEEGLSQEEGQPNDDELDASALAEIDQKYQNLVTDLFRVMGLSFSYLGGSEALERLFERVGERHYDIIVYDQYSDLLLSKEQYTDAISVYEGYIAQKPLSKWAPRYQINIIETLKKAGFIADVRPQKIRFIEEYGLASAYWFEHRHKDMTFVNQQLEVLIPEQANRHYVLAQKAAKQNKETERLEHYQQAARYYQNFVDTFPDHKATGDNLFLLAETRAQLKEWPSAIRAFEDVGYNFPNFERASEAAYASILVYNDYARTWSDLPPELLEENLAAQQASRLRFVEHHKKDPRASDVLYVSTQFSFGRKDYETSISLAQRLIDWLPAIAPATLLEARIIKAHSLYALQDYLLAEQAYLAALKQMPEKDSRRTALFENLSASIYRQAEQRLEAGDLYGAVDELLRIGQVAPGSSLRSNAEYDAISHLVELKEWTRAIELMRFFRSSYPKHELIDTLVPKLALAYRETEQWELAADELKTMIKLAKTPEEKQDTLYIAAELYDRANNKTKAILNYRSYANTYPKPADQYMEAANRLAELYDDTNDQIKRRFWLAKQMKTVDALGSAADDRMVYLAASASAVLANDAFIQYKRIKLKLPLNESMTQKTAALEKAMKAYQKTASYGISSYSTEAGYRMADIYAQLSRDLMDSDRPGGLNALELEQYEILLEEQAFPFEDSAIEIHEQNASRAWSGIYDDWVQQSFSALKALLPGRYDKSEQLDGLVNSYE